MHQVICLTLCLLAGLTTQVEARTASFADFDRRAQAGERLTVVFFGASLTWGANATDPQQTSYRALIAQRLQRQYPVARFTFWDAAIGGTGSQLGVFRFDRDVARRQPDLVFIDFSANDDIGSADLETLASYESLVRRTIVELQAPVVQVIFPFQWNVSGGKLDGMPRRDAHLAIGKAYNTAVGDAIALAVQRVKDKQIKLEELWPVDGVHPCDAGYELFADAAWDALVTAVKNKVTSAAPEKMLHGDTYMKNSRVRISSLGQLPVGWQVSRPNVVSAYFDMLMSRWLDDETIVARPTPAKDAADADDKPKDAAPLAVERLKVRFSGSMIMLFGESTTKSSKYRVYLDGQLVEYKEGNPPQTKQEFDGGKLGRMVNGNAHHAQVLAIGLDTTSEHTLEIEPLFGSPEEQELRLESTCVAGGKATVRREP